MLIDGDYRLTKPAWHKAHCSGGYQLPHLSITWYLMVVTFITIPMMKQETTARWERGGGTFILADFALKQWWWWCSLCVVSFAMYMERPVWRWDNFGAKQNAPCIRLLLLADNYHLSASQLLKSTRSLTWSTTDTSTFTTTSVPPMLWCPVPSCGFHIDTTCIFNKITP